MSATGQLRCTIALDDDGTAMLHVSAETAEVHSRIGDGHNRLGKFAGASEACFKVLDLVTFARRLEAYRISQGEAIRIAGGYYSQDAPVLLDEHVMIEVYPIGHRGYLGVHVRLADDVGRPDSPHQRHAVSLEIITTYNALGRFGSELVELAEGRGDVAVLDGYDGR